VLFSKGPPWRASSLNLGRRSTRTQRSFLFDGVLIAVPSPLSQCISIQITIAITPKDPTTVRATKPRSKKSILIRPVRRAGTSVTSTTVPRFRVLVDRRQRRARQR